MRCFIGLLGGLFVATLVSVGVAADPAGFKTLEIGDAAPDFRLPGVDGKDYSLADFAKAKLLAVVFTCNHCPTAQAYEERIIQLHADYKDKGVALVAISPNDPLAVRLEQPEIAVRRRQQTVEAHVPLREHRVEHALHPDGRRHRSFIRCDVQARA